MKKKLLAGMLAFAMAAGNIIGGVATDRYSILAAETGKTLAEWEGKLSAQETELGKIGVEFTEVTDAAKYEIQRKSTGDNDFKTLAQVLPSDTGWEKFSIGEKLGEEVYKEDFENNTLEGFTVTGAYLKKDSATVNPNTSNYILCTEWNHIGYAQSKALAITDNTSISLDLRIDAPASTNDTYFSLIGDSCENHTFSSEKQILTIKAIGEGTGGKWGTIEINGSAQTTAGASIASLLQTGANTGNKDSNKAGLTGRATTGWLHLDATIDFSSQKVKLVITRLDENKTELYNETLDFVHPETTSLEHIYFGNNKDSNIVAATSIDNISVKKIEIDYRNKYLYTDQTAAPAADHEYRVIAKDSSDNVLHTYPSVNLKTMEATVELQALVESYAGINSEQFTPESWNAYREKLTAAKELIQNQAATVAQAKALQTELIAAHDNLILTPGVITAEEGNVGKDYVDITFTSSIPTTNSGYKIERKTAAEDYETVKIISPAEADETVTAELLKDQSGFTFFARTYEDNKGLDDFPNGTCVTSKDFANRSATADIIKESDNSVLSLYNGTSGTRSAVCDIDINDAKLVKVDFDFKQDAKSNINSESQSSIQLMSADNKTLFKVGNKANTDKKWAEMSVNDTPLTDAIEIGASTGWFHLSGEFDFDSNTADVVITRKSDNQIVYDDTIALEADSTLVGMHIRYDRYITTFLDNVLVTAYPTRYTYTDKNLAPETAYTYKLSALTNGTNLSGEPVEDIEISTEFTRTTKAENFIDKQNLQKLYDEVKDYKQADYEAAGWSDFETARNTAKTLLADETATQDAVDAALTALETAKAALVKVVKVTKITVTAKDGKVKLTAKGDTVQLFTAVLPDNAPNKNVTWSSSAKDIASVSETGLVTAVKNGKSTITATAADGSEVDGSIEITVEIPNGGDEDVTPTTVTITAESETTLKKAGDTVKLNASVAPEGASQEVIWSSSNDAIATVDNTGLVTAVANGTATITATAKDAENVKNTIEITVDITTGGNEDVAPTAVTITPAGETTLKKAGDTVKLNASVAPEGASQEVIWSSSNDAIATVDNTGLVTAVANGTATITAAAKNADDIKSSIDILVQIPSGSGDDGNNGAGTEIKVQNITVTAAADKKTLTAVNETVQLTASVTPENASNKNVTWSSSNQAVATVDAASGLVTAVANGTADITATAADGSGKTGSITITVALKPTTTSAPKDTKLTDSKKNKFMVTVQGLSDGTAPEAAFTGTDAKGKIVSIPPSVTVGGVTYKVTSVGKGVLNTSQKKNVTSVKFGSNIKKIDADAFTNSTKLKTVTLNGNLEEIGKNAFKGCTALTKIKIPAKVKTIGDFAFSGAKKLATVEIGKNVTKIGKSAFEKCTALKKITIPDKVTEIGDKAFYKNTKMTSVTIGKKVTKIGKQAFNGCKILKNVKVNSTKLKTVGKNAFKGVKKGAQAKVPAKQKKAYKNLLKPLKVK